MKVRDCRNDFKKALILMSEIYERSLSSASIELYYRLLKDYEWSKVRAAFELILKTSKFFPKPAEIISLVEQRPDEELEEEIEILNAWKALLVEFKKTSQIEKPRFEKDPEPQKTRLQETVDALGGWQACCMWEVKDYPYLFRLFSQIYRTVSLVEKLNHQKLTGSNTNHKKLPGE